jgi:2-oxoglutarate ferredoxin oxidoreductase subunit beta
MPSVATGALMANHTMRALGVSGDGDTASIGFGQFAHLMRRNLPLIYIIEDNGVYGLTKGQFSATADLGSTLKTGVINDLPPIDTCVMAVELGATFVGRSFSGDKKQLLAMLKAAIAHNGTVMLDVISPCVTFNDHEGSTRSYAYTREHYDEMVHTDFVPPAGEIAVSYAPGETTAVSMHDGSRVLLRKVEAQYDATDRAVALETIQQRLKHGEYLTGLLYIGSDQPELHALNGTPDLPLNQIPYAKLNPGTQALAKTLARFR